MDRQETTRRTRLLKPLFVVALTLAATRAGDAGPGPHDNAVTRWNRLAAEILPVAVGPLIDARAMAILHAAVHDALNGIERRYEPYTADLSAPGASIDAAVARA